MGLIFSSIFENRKENHYGHYLLGEARNRMKEEKQFINFEHSYTHDSTPPTIIVFVFFQALDKKALSISGVTRLEARVPVHYIFMLQ